MKNVSEFFKFAEDNFPSEDKEENRRDAEFILSEVLNVNRIDLFLSEIEISEKDNLKLNKYFNRISSNEPLQHVLGYAYFRNLKLTVNKNVLIPRPETELLIDKALELVNREKLLIMDIGTGSGAIALSIAESLPESEIIAVDISEEAIKVAKHNCLDNNLSNVKFIQNDLCSGFPNDYADIIIANLPYVSKEEYKYLENKVKLFEPDLALCGGSDGLDLIKLLIRQSTAVLKKNGWLLLEIGYEQGKTVSELFTEIKYFTNISIMKDLNNLDRFVIGQKK